MLGMRKLGAALMLGAGVALGAVGGEAGIGSGRRAVAWRPKNNSKPQTDVNKLSAERKLYLGAKGTHFWRGNKLLSVKKFTNHLPRGFDNNLDGDGNIRKWRRGENPIGVNGIRGNKGCGR